jgi:hypothetical protein
MDAANTTPFVLRRCVASHLSIRAIHRHKDYTLAEIKDYTNNFDLALLIGQGVSGKVYKGKLHDGREVAVKRLQDGLRHAQDKFSMELALIQLLGHDHIVRLVGSCAEGEVHILVYDHMDNGSGGAASARRDVHQRRVRTAFRRMGGGRAR